MMLLALLRHQRKTVCHGLVCWLEMGKGGPEGGAYLDLVGSEG